MRTKLLASLTSKVVGIAAGTLAAGSAGAAVLTQAISDEQPAPATSTVDSTEVAHDDVDVDAVVNDANDEVADDTGDDAATDAGEAEDADDDAPLGSFDENVDTPTAHEHPDNFGKVVSERAHSEGGNKGGVADLAHEKNAERKGTDVSADDSADDADESDDSTDATTADPTADTPASHGKSGGHGKSDKH